MTTFLIIITIYILNILLNRYLNKILCKIDKYQTPSPFTWFFSIMTTVALIIVILIKMKTPNNWFTGKYW